MEKMKQTITILMGMDGVGKTYLAKQMSGFSTRVIDCQTIDCVQQAVKWLEFGSSLIVDGDNLSQHERQTWTDLGDQFRVEMKCIWLCNGLELGYSEPELSEGFSEIVIRKVS